MLTRTITSVIFDAVGTLIYPSTGVSTVYASAGRRYGSKLTESEVALRFRAAYTQLESRDRLGDLQTSESFEFARWQEIVRQVLDDVTDYEGCFADVWRHFAQPSSWQVFPEVPGVLADLAQRGFRLAIASNFDRRLLEIAAKTESLLHCRTVLVSSEIGNRKPHRRFFEATAAALGVKHQEAIYVGDDPHNDVDGARAVGMTTVLLDRSGPGDNGSISSLTELLTLLVDPTFPIQSIER